MSFTEFYMQSTGNDLNAGSTNADAASLSYTGLDLSGGNTLTRGSGSFVTDGVVVGDWVSVYADGGSAWVYTAQVTVVAALSLTLSTTRKAGVIPGNGTGNRSAKIGGAWATRAVFDAMGTAVDLRDTTTGDMPCINVKGALAAVTGNAVSFGANVAGAAMVVWGYTTTVRDGGYGTIQQTSGGSVQVWSVNFYVTTRNMIFDGGAPTVTHSNAVFVNATDHSPYINCRFNNYQGQVRPGSSTDCVFILCQFYKGNVNNTASAGGLYSNGGQLLLYGCTFYECKRAGVYTLTSSRVIACSFVNNAATTGDGLVLGGANQYIFVMNCNFANNAGNGINVISDHRNLMILSCLFRSNTGTDINLAGQTRVNTLLQNNAYYRTSGSFVSASPAMEFNTTALGSDPFTGDPTTGDLAVNSQVKDLGFLTGFTPDLATTSTPGNLDVGAMQMLAAAGGLILARPMNGGYSA